MNVDFGATKLKHLKEKGLGCICRDVISFSNLRGHNASMALFSLRKRGNLFK